VLNGGIRLRCSHRQFEAVASNEVESGAKDARTPNASRGTERLVRREAFGVRASLAPLLASPYSIQRTSKHQK